MKIRPLIPEVRLLLEAAGGSASFSDRAVVRALREAFDESKVHRRPDGEFGTGGGDAHASAVPGAAHAAVRKWVVGGDEELHAAVKVAAAQLGREAFDALPPAVQRTVSKTYQVAMAVHHKLETGYAAAQGMVSEVARQRGLSPEHVERTARIVAAADLVARWTVPTAVWAGMGMSEVGGVAAKVAYYTPIASLAYLGYSTARNPMATVRAARKLLAAKKTGAVHESRAEDADAVARLLALLADAGDPDWCMALVSAGLDDGCDLAGAVEAAAGVLAETPENPAGEETGESILREAFDESKVHRRPDGEFGTGGGGAAGKDDDKTPRERYEDERAAWKKACAKVDADYAKAQSDWEQTVAGINAAHKAKHEKAHAEWARRAEERDRRSAALDDLAGADPRLGAGEADDPATDFEKYDYTTPEGRKKHLEQASVYVAAQAKKFGATYADAAEKASALGADKKYADRLADEGRKGAAALQAKGDRWVKAVEKDFAAQDRWDENQEAEPEEDGPERDAWEEKDDALEAKSDGARAAQEDAYDSLDEAAQKHFDRADELLAKAVDEAKAKIDEEADEDDEPEEDEPDADDYPDEPDEPGPNDYPDEPDEPDDEDEEDEEEEEEPDDEPDEPDDEDEDEDE